MFFITYMSGSDPMPLTVTFDTNTLASVVSPETAQRGTGTSGATVRTAIQAGHIQGFFSETVVTLEGITNADRSAVFGSTTVNARYRHETALDGSGVTHIDLRPEQPARRALDQRQADRFRGAFELGMKLLTAPRVGKVSVDDPEGMRYLAEPNESELTRRLDKYCDVVTAIEARGLGCAQAQRIAGEIRAEVGGHRPFDFYLGSPRSLGERKKINRAIGEWADGDSVAAHFGYNIDLFCSEDFRKSASGPSVLDCDNRKWLSEEFGIQFVTLAELAKRVTV
jgi:hypothetical protein